MSQGEGLGQSEGRPGLPVAQISVLCCATKWTWIMLAASLRLSFPICKMTSLLCFYPAYFSCRISSSFFLQKPSTENIKIELIRMGGRPGAPAGDLLLSTLAPLHTATHPRFPGGVSNLWVSQNPLCRSPWGFLKSSHLPKSLAILEFLRF